MNRRSSASKLGSKFTRCARARVWIARGARLPFICSDNSALDGSGREFADSIPLGHYQIRKMKRPKTYRTPAITTSTIGVHNNISTRPERALPLFSFTTCGLPFSKRSLYVTACPWYSFNFRYSVVFPMPNTRAAPSLFPERCLCSMRLLPCEFARGWVRLQPYRIAIPLDCSPLVERFFATDITAALAILQARHKRADGAHPQSASPRR
jgi:hypothetical protein